MGRQIKTYPKHERDKKDLCDIPSFAMVQRDIGEVMTEIEKSKVLGKFYDFVDQKVENKRALSDSSSMSYQILGKWNSGIKHNGENQLVNLNVCVIYEVKGKKKVFSDYMVSLRKNGNKIAGIHEGKVVDVKTDGIDMIIAEKFKGTIADLL